MINDSPFRGLRGTIRSIHIIADDLDEPFCFYLVALEGVNLKEPLWFEYHEVEPVAPPAIGPVIGESLPSLNSA